MMKCFDAIGDNDGRERMDANGENRKMCCCTKVTDKKEEEFTYLIYEKVK